jgi:hypothetical protein
MAINDTTGNPWRFDNADTGVITTAPFFAKRFVWTPTTDGDDISLTDNSGHVLWAFKAIAADTNQGIEYERVIEGSINGLTIGTLDNGTLYIYQ